MANHSCLVADLVEERGADADAVLWALLHDASEAYLVDLPHPLKHRSALGALYAEVEGPAAGCDLRALRAPGQPPLLLKAVDRALLATERRAVSQVAWDWPELEGVEPLELEIDPWLPDRAHDEFLARFERHRRPALVGEGLDRVPASRDNARSSVSGTTEALVLSSGGGDEEMSHRSLEDC